MGGGPSRPKYMGEILDGVRHGQGRMVWKDGRKFDGTFVKGSREGFGAIELANGDKYVGEWHEDQMHGKGKYTSSESEYEGHWAQGLREGKGKLTLKSGSVYEGKFHRHMYHGHGLLKLPDGTYYDGEFKHGQMQGIGFRTYADGSMYEGSFVQGDCHGRGRWFSVSEGGWLFDGSFQHGRPVDGEMVRSNGDVWHHVYPISTLDTKGFKGRNLDPTLRRFVGCYGKGWNGHRDFTGNMIWKWADGREFRGQFHDGAPIQGRLFDSDKAWYDVQYSEEIRISDDRLKPNFKRLAPEEVEKDLAFSRNLEQIQRKLESEEEAYEQMLHAIEAELEARVLAETKLYEPPPQTPSPVLDYGEFVRKSSSAHVSVHLKLGIDFHSIGTSESIDRLEFMANVIQDLVVATGTHERIFRITSLKEGSVILDIEILSDPKEEFTERSPAEIALFLLEQSKKPLSKFMRGKLTKKLLEIELPPLVYEVLRQEEEDRKPKPEVKVVVQEDPIPSPPKWSPSLQTRTWHPGVSGIGFHVGRLDLRAASRYKEQLEAVHQYNMDQIAKRPKPRPRVPTPEPEYLSGAELVEQIREFVAFLYAGATLKNKSIPDDEKYKTHPTTAATNAHPTTSYARRTKTGKSAQSSQGIVRERRDQRRAAQGLLELLGGNPDGTIDSENGWYSEPCFDKKLQQATSTAEVLWAHGGIKALVYVLRGAYADPEFVEVLSKAHNEKEYDQIVRSSVAKGEVDIRELAAECISRACTLNPANRMRLRMKIGPNRPDGDGVLALVDLLQKGPDGSRERAAAALSIICKGDLQSKEDVSLELGVEALLDLFSDRCPASIKLSEINRLFQKAESRKFRASAAANQQMAITQMEEAQKEMDYFAESRRVLEHRLVKLREAAMAALYIITTDCFSACESLLLHGGLEVMIKTIIDRRQHLHADLHRQDASRDLTKGMTHNIMSRERLVEVESAVGIVENICRSFFTPGVLKEPSAAVGQSCIGSGGVAAAARGEHDMMISSNQLENLSNQIERLDILRLLCEHLHPNIDVVIQARAAGALWVIVEGERDSSTARILDMDGMTHIARILRYSEADQLEARELTVGLLSSMLKGSPRCAAAAKGCGAISRLMQLMNLGDDGLGAFSTQELAASALVDALTISEECRSDARRSGIRTMIKALTDSPLLLSPDDLERQQAVSSKKWADKLMQIVNRPPERGKHTKPKEDLNWGVAQATTIQNNFRVFSSRRKLRSLRTMPQTLRMSLLRIENAIPNRAAFQKYCALETEEGDGGHLGSRALSMDVHEWVEVLKHLDILHMHAEEKHKVSKTQAIAAFKSINTDAQQTVNGRKLPPPQELDFERYQKCLKRCLKMLRSEAEAVGEVQEEEDRSVSPLAKPGGRRPAMTQPNAGQGLFKRTHSTVLKRVRGPLVGKASVINFLTASGAGVLGEGFAGLPYPQEPPIPSPFQ